MMSIITIVYAVSISTESTGKEIKWLVTPRSGCFRCSNSEFHRTFQFPERGRLYNSRSRTSKAF